MWINHTAVIKPNDNEVSVAFLGSTLAVVMCQVRGASQGGTAPGGYGLHAHTHLPGLSERNPQG